VAVVLLLLSVAACAAPRPTAPAPPVAASALPAAPAAERTFAILAINDVYRIEGVDQGARGGMARLRTLRAELEAEHPDLLLLHAGDFLYPSFPSRMFRGAQMVDVLNLLDGDAAGFDRRMYVTFGNHEFDKGKLADAASLDLRVEESAFWWLGTNLEFAAGEDGRPVVGAHNLLPTALVEAGGVRVGLFSLTIGTTDPEYVAAIADPEATARRTAAELRAAGAEVVVALTHLDAQQDAALLQALGAAGPDLVVGGHDHQAMALDVDGRLVLKSDADAVTARVIEVGVPAGGGAPRVEHRLVDLGPGAPAPDPDVAAVVAAWGERHDRLFCAGIGEPAGCLGEEVGRTAVELVAEELEIRLYETNLGDWVADRMLDAFDEPSELPAGVEPAPVVGFINSGSLRLNQDVPAGPVTRGVVEELFAYPAPTVLLEIDGATLRRVLERSIEGWSGGGWWLQVAGLAFRHDPQAGTVSDLTLLTPDGPRPLDPAERILAVTQTYLVDPTMGDQDGYTMLHPQQIVASGPDLKQRVLEALAATPAIAPEIQGRICNPQHPDRPCQAHPTP
jgi:2',3'-cyclic-nucleotide 2'-phosphodiesterase (5'-nucleotidase family)